MRRSIVAIGLVVAGVVAGCGESESDRYYGRVNRQIEAQAWMQEYQACVKAFRAKRGAQADASSACAQKNPSR